MNKDEKAKLVEELREALTAAPSVVLASSVGIGANDMNELRAKIRASGARYHIVKNTLAKRAIEGTDLAELAAHFVGPTAIAWHPDEAVAPAKVLVDFRKKEEKLEIKAGFLNGGVISVSDVNTLATMPGKDELRAKLLSVFNGVPTKFVRTLAAGPQSFLTLLTARKDSIG